MTFTTPELEPVFAIPTIRLRDVPETVKRYDEHFHDMNRKIDIWLFDDSPYDLHERYYPRLQETPTFNDVYMVGPSEKTQFLDYLMRRTGVAMADTIIAKMFKPSYGGNRNFTLLYTLGRKFISADDDMQPGGYIFKQRQNLRKREVLRGQNVSSLNATEFVQYDLIGAFLDTLGKKPTTIGLDYGEFVEDANYDLLTNTRKTGNQNTTETTLHLKRIESPAAVENSKIRIAQSFMSGTNDLDSLEVLEMFLRSSEKQVDQLSETFVVSAFKPFLTKYAWNFACGVSGYDNTDPLPPFFPTNLRFEDYSFRLWAQREGVASAHVNAVQHHTRNPYMRPPLVKDIFYDFVATFLKNKLRETMEPSRDNDFTMKFNYDGVVRRGETDQILQRLIEIHAQISESEASEKDPERIASLTELRNRLKYEAMDFDSDHFLNKFSGIIDNELYTINDCMNYWQTILEITLLRQKQKKLPITKIANLRK